MSSAGSTFDLEVVLAAARRLGVELDSSTQLADLAAVAITRLAWRDGPLEDWHAAPASRISDAEMLRANVATTRLVRGMIGRLLDDDAPPGERDAAVVVGGAVRAVVGPDRRLPDGRTLAELAPGRRQLLLLQEHASALATLWARGFVEFGVREVLSVLACCAARWCWRWWLTPTWPNVVDAVVRHITATVRDEHLPLLLGAAPSRCGDESLAAMLLAGPDRHSSDMASYVVRAGLGRLAPQDCGLPPMPRRPVPSTYLSLVWSRAPG